MSSPINDPRHWLKFVPDTLKASPLYTELWKHLKDDPEMLAFMELADKNQPLLIIFFTVVNFLLLAEPHHPLALYYPYLHQTNALPVSEAYSFFREFVFAHREEVCDLLPTARLQTNEVTRCANLLPAFILAYQRSGYQPLNMIEIGSSAGLNLLWHKYCYHYGSSLTTDDIIVGDLSSPIQIRCEIVGSHLPPLSEAALPVVASCQGIELVPRDISDEQDMRWVRAAIWPEEGKRHQVLDAAIVFARQQGISLHAGDACDLLPAMLAAIPPSQTAIIWDSYAINQGPIAVQQRILQQLVDASRERKLYRASLEFAFEQQAPGPQLALYEYQGGEIVKQEVLARCAVHGEHMIWLPVA